LHYLWGNNYFDGNIRTVVNYTPSSQLKVQSISETRPAAECGGRQALDFQSREPATKTNQIAPLLKRASAEQYGICFQLTGTDLTNKESIVKTIAQELRSGLIELSYLNVPIDTDQLHWLKVRLKRWQLIDNSLLHIKADQLRNDDHIRIQTLRQLTSSLQIPLIISVDEPSDWGVDNTVNIEVNVPGETDQIALWRKYLALQLTPELDKDIPKLVSQFNLSAPAIKTIASRFYLDTPKGKSTFDSLWSNCRVQARQKLDSLATRVSSNASWSNLILPENTKKQLANIISQVDKRAAVYQQFGFNNNRGSGITALFSGVSGTGKTTAAEVIANELKLDLYKIELSTVISKYIGETEKNLRRIFDAAEAGGAILLFDEADALFGKRSEVKDSKDRYANAEISYLLQKMESYRGLAILTTNIKDAIDSAFKRRLRFVIDFPFPDAATREQIWRSVFPKQAPTHELNYDLLAQLNLSGGNIFSIALNSAFEAASDREPIQMKHLVSAARYEIDKLELDSTKLEMLASRLERDREVRRGASPLGYPSGERQNPSIPDFDKQTYNFDDTDAATLRDNEQQTVEQSEIRDNTTGFNLSIHKPEHFQDNNKASLLNPEQIFSTAQQWLKENNYVQAYQVLTEGITDRQDHSGLLFWLGWVIYHGKLNFSEALSAFERAESGNQQWLNNHEQAVATWYWQAKVLDEMPDGDLNKVCELYQKYYTALPNGTYTQQAKRKYNEARMRRLFPEP
jgi:AAA+ superfamily predicted ATPase